MCLKPPGYYASLGKRKLISSLSIPFLCSQRSSRISTREEMKIKNLSVAVALVCFLCLSSLGFSSLFLSWKIKQARIKSQELTFFEEQSIGTQNDQQQNQTLVDLIKSLKIGQEIIHQKLLEIRSSLEDVEPSSGKNRMIDFIFLHTIFVAKVHKNFL